MMEQSPDDLGSRFSRLGSLADDVRRRLYDHVVSRRGEPVSRDEAARACGISRSLAAYHLDRLVDDGLLDTRFERRSGRRGPGAGRPAKLYLRSPLEVAVSLPPRDDELAARLLARAVETADAHGAAQAGAAELGRSLGAEARSRLRTNAGAGRVVEALRSVLAERGYEPYEENGRLALRNCPFDHLTGDHRELVCGMNLALLDGLVHGAGLEDADAALDPQPGRCCVTLRLPE